MIPTLASARVQVDRGMNVPERLMLDPMQVESEKTWGKEAWGQHTCGISFVLHRNGNSIRADDACSAHAVHCLVTQDDSCFRHLGCYDLQDTNSEDCANSHPLHDGQM